MKVYICSRKFAPAFLFAATLSLAHPGASQTTSEDNVMAVHAAYQKLSTALQVQQIRETVLSGKPATPEEATTPPKITLSNISSGEVSAIQGEIYGDLVSKPSGSVLQISPGVWNFTLRNGTKQTAEIAMAAWKTEPYLAEDWNQPLSRLLAQGTIDPSYTSYVSYTVSLAYLGKERQYKAMFLFGPGTSSQPKLLPLDQVIGPSALTALINARTTPDPLLSEPFHSRPMTQRFLATMKAPASCNKEGNTGLCCAKATGECGVPDSEMQVHGFDSVSALKGFSPDCGDICSSYNSSGTSVPESSGVLTGDHYSGSHSGSVSFQGNCSYSGSGLPCTGLCHVSVLAPTTAESGTTIAYVCHNRPTNSNGNDTQGNGTACSGSWGFAAVGCALCTCAGTVNVGIPAPGGGSVGVSYGGSGTTLNTWGWGLTYGGCPTIQ